MKVGFWFFTKIVAELGASAFATHQICMKRFKPLLLLQRRL
jgi:Na+-driven multidrug efflux pump